MSAPRRSTHVDAPVKTDLVSTDREGVDQVLVAVVLIAVSLAGGLGLLVMMIAAAVQGVQS